MQAKIFEDMLVWKRAKELTISVYKHFSTSKDFWFRDQIQRASISIMNNIAEWFERKWNREFIKFLYIAKWSCGELRSMLDVWLELEYIPKDSYNNFHTQAIEIAKMLGWLIKSLQSQPN